MPEAELWNSSPPTDYEKSWLYQQQGNVFGPLTTKQLLDKIKTGQAPGDVVVSEDGRDDWHPIHDVEDFRAALPKALAALQALRAQQALDRASARKRALIIAAVCVLIVIGSGAFVFFQKKIAHDREVARLQAIENQQAKEREQQHAEQEKKRVALAMAGKTGDIELDLELMPLVRVQQKKAPTGKHKGKQTEEGPQGCQLDQGSLTGTFRSAFPNIKACVKDEMRRAPADLPSSLTLSFTIANTGSVASFEVDERSVQRSPFGACLKKVVMGLKFKSFPGERCNIDYPIAIGAKK